jgi:hypothetical protein
MLLYLLKNQRLCWQHNATTNTTVELPKHKNVICEEVELLDKKA